jgi:hypothetical protein
MDKNSHVIPWCIQELNSQVKYLMSRFDKGGTIPSAHVDEALKSWQAAQRVLEAGYKAILDHAVDHQCLCGSYVETCSVCIYKQAYAEYSKLSSIKKDGE